MVTIDERLAVIQPLHKFWYKGKVLGIDVLRLDLIHPIVSGNKWFKLRLNLANAVDDGFKTVLTFGGGYSNHLVATAYAAKKFNIPAVAIVRGKYDKLTPTLQSCVEYGMELIFVTQEEYKNNEQPDWIRQMAAHFDDIYIIPEGGANELGRTGAGLMDRFIDKNYTHIAIAVGSGTTLIGLRNKLKRQQYIIGFVPMKEGKYMEQSINKHLDKNKNTNWHLQDEWHFGGFGKWNKELITFMNEFYDLNKIPLDIVYTSKMMYGLNQLLLDNYFISTDKILCIHSGGLQGNISVQKDLIY